MGEVVFDDKFLSDYGAVDDLFGLGIQIVQRIIVLSYLVDNIAPKNVLKIMNFSDVGRRIHFVAYPL